MGRMFDLSGRLAVVIGGGRGIGRAAAEALAEQGATVVVADQSHELLEEAFGGRERFVPRRLDVLDSAQLEALAAEFPETDVLLHCPAKGARKLLVDLTREEVEGVLRLNVVSLWDAIRCFAPAMVRRGRGSVIAFSSIRATTVEPGQGVYSASKGAVGQLVRGFASELSPSGVRVNAIAPGVVETPLTASLRSNPEWYRAYAEKTALGRWARPDEMAGAVVYLASDASSYVTGSVLAVDGGWTAVDGRYDPPV